MMTPARANQLAVHALRLLRQQSLEVLTGVFATTPAEILDAMEWLEHSARTPPPRQPSADSANAARLFARKTEAAINARTEFLANGQARDHTDYKRVAGEIAGLRLALNLLGDTLKNIEEDDDTP